MLIFLEHRFDLCLLVLIFTRSSPTQFTLPHPLKGQIGEWIQANLPANDATNTCTIYLMDQFQYSGTTL